MSVISFGKYKGEDYFSLWENDRGYCEWVLSLHGSEVTQSVKEAKDELGRLSDIERELSKLTELVRIEAEPWHCVSRIKGMGLMTEAQGRKFISLLEKAQEKGLIDFEIN